MATYYVSVSGNNNGTGSSGSPWRTISRAMQAELEPGDEIVVRPGTYREQVFIEQGGTSGHHITLRSEIPGEALIRPPAGAYSTVHVQANYVTIDGFDVQGGGGHAIEAHYVHHVNIHGNITHDSGGSGISAGYGEFFEIVGNTSYNNASTNEFHTSGISVYQARNISGDTTSQGYRIIVKDNVSYNNVESAAIRSEHTDGNGIIIDDFQNNQGGSRHGIYAFPTLVEGNLVYGNGAKGIQVVWSDNVTIRNNTAYHNNQDQLAPTTWRGELSNSQSSNNVWVNNIGVADPAAHSSNTAIGNYSYDGYVNDVIWKNNLTFNGKVGDASVLAWDSPAPRAADNMFGVNPRFLNPPASFELAANSPAVNAGTDAYGIAVTDIDGDPRAVGRVDIGAYEYRSGTAPDRNTAPVAVDDSGFTVNQSGWLRIDSVSLLGNDTDADHDRLTITAVGGAVGGRVSLAGDGTVIFSADSATLGPASFAYRISDGNGGTDTARVQLTVSQQQTPDPDGPVQTFSFWNGQTTSSAKQDSDTKDVELGLRFTADEAGEVSAIRIFHSGRGPDLTGRLWTDAGEVIGSVTFDGSSGKGWITATFDQPVSLAAGESYVVSYFAQGGKYHVIENALGSPRDIGPLSIRADAGVFSYGAEGSFPTNSFKASNYLVDVVFRASDPNGGDPGGGSLSDDGIIGQSGRIRVSQAGPEKWTQVKFAHALDDPSVVMGGATMNGTDPFTIRVKDVTSTGFRFQIDEWDYLDGKHMAESISWIAVEAGVHRLDNGLVIEAGSMTASGRVARESFAGGAFADQPVVLGQVASRHETSAVTDRISAVTDTGFKVQLFREGDARAKLHGSEEFHWIAVSQGEDASGNGGALRMLADRPTRGVTDKPSPIDFDGMFQDDSFVFIADTQSLRGKDSGDLRLMSLAKGEAVVQFQENQAHDAELQHVAESVGFLALDPGLIYSDLPLG